MFCTACQDFLSAHWSGGNWLDSDYENLPNEQRMSGEEIGTIINSAVDKWKEYRGTLRQLTDSAGQGCYICRAIKSSIDGSDEVASALASDDLNRIRLQCLDQEIDGTGLLLFEVLKPEGSIHTIKHILAIQSEADPEILAAQYEYPDSTDLPWSIAETWLNQCLETHEMCKNGLHYGYVPTRLIDVGINSNSKIHLIISYEQTIQGPYTTLSHCWGALQPLSLKRANLEAFLDHIPWRELPRSFQDAVNVTRRLGILWIDSLCIIQDDDWREDWTRESSLMEKVYSNAMLNLGATAGRDGSHGLYHSMPRIPGPQRFLMPFQGANRTEIQRPYCIYDFLMWKKELGDSPLASRAWIVQERFLSPRTLHFGARLMWECSVLDANQNFPCGIPSLIGNKGIFKTSIKKQTSSLINTWANLVELYSAAQLTNIEDKLIAISGVARRLSSISGDSEYWAGHWKKSLPFTLLWWVKCNSRDAMSRPYTAPSFSWASVDGSIKHWRWVNIFGVASSRAEVLEINVENASLDPFGSVCSGYLRLSCHLIPIRLISHQSQHQFEYRGYENDDRFLEFWKGSNVTTRVFPDNSSVLAHENIHAIPIRGNDQHTDGILVREKKIAPITKG
ncbi:heterokaryon incompatibility protein-domain-containing protein [Cadophora sp. MPI-SDFR-AT-0126]|nr:heterokaryon incompatibility protein-domain-containing protein [Leotiomycetes sp. MPI-SDFR-AT-0126]